MKSVATPLSLFALLVCTSAAAAPPRLIVRGDDMGFSHSGNEALIRCFTDGIETSIEVIVPSPWFPEAVQLLRQHPDVDVGVHLALTSEWDNVKWRPLTEATTLRDAHGYFYPMIYPNKNYPDQALAQQDWRAEEIEAEFRAQIALAKELIPRISHVSCHMACDGLSDEVRRLTRRLAKEFDIDIDLDEKGVRRVRLTGPRETSAQKITAFMKMLGTLEDDTTYCFVEHPGINTSELQAIHHVGYEQVAADRQGVTDMWTSPRVKKHLQDLGIELISYRDLE